MFTSQVTLMPGRLVNRKDLQCSLEVAEFWMYLLFSKDCFIGWVTPRLKIVSSSHTLFPRPSGLLYPRGIWLSQ